MTMKITSRQFVEDIMAQSSGVSDIPSLLKSIISLLAFQNAPVRFIPQQGSFTTSATANTASSLVSSETNTSFFVVQNNGTATITVAARGAPVNQGIAIAPGTTAPIGSVFLESLGLFNYYTNLQDWQISATAASVPYTVIWFITEEE